MKMKKSKRDVEFERAMRTKGSQALRPSPIGQIQFLKEAAGNPLNAVSQWRADQYHHCPALPCDRGFVVGKIKNVYANPLPDWYLVRLSSGLGTLDEWGPGSTEHLLHLPPDVVSFTIEKIGQEES